jgi:hypothetical protein
MAYKVTSAFISTLFFSKTPTGSNLIFDYAKINGNISFTPPSSDIIINEVGIYTLNVTNLEQGMSVWLNDGVSPIYSVASSTVIDSSTQVILDITRIGTIVNIKNNASMPVREISLDAGVQLTLVKELSTSISPYSNITVLQPQAPVIADSVPNSVAVQPYTPVPNQVAQQGYDGWYFTNTVAGNHINWYMPTPMSPNGTPLTVNDLDNFYATLKIFNVVSLPYINIYTEIGSGGQNPANKGGSWYQSRFQYDPSVQYSAQIATQVVTSKDLAGNFLGANINIIAQVPKVNTLAPIVTNHTNYAVALSPSVVGGGGSKGTLNGAEKIIAISINTNSGALPSGVKFIAQSIFVSETVSSTSNQFNFLNETIALQNAQTVVNRQFNIAQNDSDAGLTVLPLDFFTFDTINSTNTATQLEYVAGSTFISVLDDCDISIDFSFTTISTGPLTIQIQNNLVTVSNGVKYIPSGIVGETSLQTNFRAIAGDKITIFNASIESSVGLFGEGSASLNITTL